MNVVNENELRSSLDVCNVDNGKEGGRRSTLPLSTLGRVLLGAQAAGSKSRVGVRVFSQATPKAIR